MRKLPGKKRSYVYVQEADMVAAGSVLTLQVIFCFLSLMKLYKLSLQSNEFNTLNITSRA